MDFTFHRQWEYKTELRIVLDTSMETAVGLFTTINPQVHLTPV